MDEGMAMQIEALSDIMAMVMSFSWNT